MTRPLPLNDFRAVRVVLEPCDFALGSDEPDPPASDLIAREHWASIMDISDDVAIRTSDHNGRFIGEAYWLWSRWIEAIGTVDDALSAPMIDSTDDLQASLFDSLHGYYRTAFSALRSVLELMTIGMCGMLGDAKRYADWRSGLVEFPFGSACDWLSNAPVLSGFNKSMRSAGYPSLWDQKSGSSQGGYGRRLYKDFCDYAHSRPGFTDFDLRVSNGPIYARKAFMSWYYAYLRTVSFCSIVLHLTRPNIDRSLIVDLFADDSNILPPDLIEAYRRL